MDITIKSYADQAVQGYSPSSKTKDHKTDEVSKKNTCFSYEDTEKSCPEPVYTKESLTDNIKDQTTFRITSYARKYEKYTKVLNEHYAKVNEENKKFPNPDNHIYQKYHNPKYPYYVKGLTKRERNLLVEQEAGVLHGREPMVNNYDPLMQETFGGIYVFVVDMEWNNQVRGEINGAIRDTLERDGIAIPEDADLKLTVDPYDFKIHAGGVDAELAKAIEKSLNRGENGTVLYYHMSFCNPASFGYPEPEQFRKGDLGKMSVYHLVKNLTGYDIRQLRNDGEKIYTPDGRDLWDVMAEKNKELDPGRQYPLGEHAGYYRRIVKEGWDSRNDFDLTIDYQNGSLMDTGTQYGYGPGQTAWQAEVYKRAERIQAEYRKERAETLRREEAEQDGLFSNPEQPMYANENQKSSQGASNIKPMGLYGLDGTFYPAEPLSEKILEMLKHASSHESWRLTNDILHPKA